MEPTFMIRMMHALAASHATLIPPAVEITQKTLGFFVYIGRTKATLLQLTDGKTPSIE